MDPYEELADFLARGPSTREIAEFRASEESSRLFEDLVRKGKTSRLTDAEHETTERFFQVEHLVRLVKGKARRLLKSEAEGVAADDASPTGPREGGESPKFPSESSVPATEASPLATV